MGATEGSIIAAIVVTQTPTYHPRAPSSGARPGIHAPLSDQR